jgi:hypothetical protein
MRSLIALLMLSVLTISLNAQKINIDSRIDNLNTILKNSKPEKRPGKELFPGNKFLHNYRSSGLVKKSTFEGKQKLDSVVSEFFNEEDSKWANESREEYYYDEKGYQTKFILSEWDAESMDWAGYIMEESEYDADGNMTLYLFSYWDEMGNDWIASSRSEISYEGGQIKFLQDFYRDEDSGEWLVSGTLEYEYIDGLLANITIGGYDLNGDEIINDLDQMRISNYYDPQGKLLREITYIYPDEETGWLAVMKSEYTYNSSSQVEQVVSYFIDDESGEWISESREFYTYDSSGNVISDSYDYWDYEMEDWQTNSLWQYSFNDTGDLLSMSLSDWDYESGSMIPSFKNEYTHNTEFSLADLILPNDYPPEYFAHMIIGYSQYEFYDNEWLMTYRGEIFYSDFNSTGIREISIPGISVFPNPAGDIVNFTGQFQAGKTRIEFFDINGKMVFSGIMPENGEVNVQSLKAGLYYYKIVSGGIPGTGKILIE